MLAVPKFHGSAGDDMRRAHPKTPSLNRRRFCGAAAVTFAAAPLGLLGYQERSKSMTQVAQQTGSGTTAIRPFPKLNVPDAQLTELRRRINATRWPTRELVADDTQGVQLTTTQALARY